MGDSVHSLHYVVFPGHSAGPRRSTVLESAWADRFNEFYGAWRVSWERTFVFVDLRSTHSRVEVNDFLRKTGSLESLLARTLWHCRPISSLTCAGRPIEIIRTLRFFPKRFCRTFGTRASIGAGRFNICMSRRPGDRRSEMSRWQKFSLASACFPFKSRQAT